MVKKTGDRRVRRTQRLLKESLLKLMKQKPFSAITVSDITEEADVNRATFYLHFSNPSRLLQSIGEDLLTEMQLLIEEHREEIVAGKTLRPLLEQVLDIVLGNQELCMLLFDHDEDSRFADKLHLLVRDRGTEIVRENSGIRPEEIPYLVEFITCGLIGMIQSWFNRGMDISREVLLDAAEAMANGASARFLPQE